METLKSSFTSSGPEFLGQKISTITNAKDESQISFFGLNTEARYKDYLIINSMIIAGVTIFLIREFLPNTHGTCTDLFNVHLNIQKSYITAYCLDMQNTEILAKIICITFFGCSAFLMFFYFVLQKFGWVRFVHKQYKAKMISQEKKAKSYLLEYNRLYVRTIVKRLKVTRSDLMRMIPRLETIFYRGFGQIVAIASLTTTLFLFKRQIQSTPVQFMCGVKMPSGEFVSVHCIYPSVLYTEYQVSLALYAFVPIICVVLVASIFMVCSNHKKDKAIYFEYKNKLDELIDKFENKNLEDKNIPEDQLKQINEKTEVFKNIKSIKFEDFYSNMEEIVGILDSLDTII